MGNAYNPLSEVDADVFARSWLDAWNSPRRVTNIRGLQR